MKTKLLYAFLFLVLSFTKAQIITTIVGNGFGAPTTGGYGGDGGQATNAELYFPFSLTLDKVGNIYVADTYNRVIRKINTVGVITTVAGGGSSGIGDGGQATAANLWDPTQVVFDGTGNMYIVDATHNRIRLVNTAGIISTVVGNGTAGFGGDGGLATAAKLHGPQYVTLDASGNLYIADVVNNRIRKVNSLGIISTVAGNGFAGFYGDGGPATAARLNGPDGVTLDATGNLYIADYSNNRIRMVNTAGIINTIVGTGVAGFSGDGGPATVAQINGPNDGIVFDALGNFYIPDALNNRVRKVNTLGIISTIAGNGTAGFSGDGGNALAAELNYPGGVALDSSLCNLYIADLYNNRIRMVSNAEVTITVNSPSVCIGNTATLTATGAANYTWTPNTNLNTNLGSTVVTTNTSNTTYSVLSTVGSCHNSAAALVTINPLPIVTINTATICVGDTGTLTASGANTYTWSTGVNTNSIVVSPTTSSNYTVVGVNTKGCVSVPAVGRITVSPYPSILISGNNNICIGENTTLTASGASTYTWSTGDTLANLVVSPVINTSYTVMGELSVCKSTVTTSVTVSNPFGFIMPNIVTPNNDGINDYIDFGTYEFSTLQLEIYNRWGAKVFESSNPACVWKPTEDDGTYFYTLQSQISCGNEKQNKTLKGFITVIK